MIGAMSFAYVCVGGTAVCAVMLTGAAHADCAKVCILQKDAAVGILTDGDGLFKIWGSAAKDKYAKVVPYLGQTVEVTGTEVTLSNNYDVRSFDLQTIKRKTTK